MRSLTGWILAGTIAFESVAAYAVPDMKGPYPTCSTPPTDSERKAAQGAFAAGQGSFNEADYSTAILYWRDAYRRDCTAHALLVNLARAYELKGDRAEAIEALEIYLQRRQDDPKAEEYQRRIQNLKAQLAAAQSSASPAANPNTPPPPPSASTRPAAAAGSPAHLNIPPLIVVGAGAVLAAGIGIPVWISGNNDVHEAEKTCKDHDNCADQHARDLGNKGRTNMFVGGALMAAGAAALTAGAIWYVLSSKTTATPGAQSSKVRFDPALGTNFAGFSLGGSF